MLALTPMPLQTAGERAFFAELARWDTGGAVRGAVVASLPMVVDGPLQRRLSDAVLLVPEGIAVVRVVDVERQSGVVTVKPEGAWTIAPGPGPGEVLQLHGGGSTPLDGLMRAGMDAAVRLRRAGLEPGRIARLTVLVGNLTGLQPEDGDLGEGDQVAILEPRSLLLGIARAGRYAGVDNPRLWTTADIRAALEALGLQGRGPSVEELNGEGFAYSPYVLRRPELLAPVSMTASSTAPPEQVAPTVPPPVAVPAPAAPAAVAQAFPPTVPVPPAPPQPPDDTGGIGGLFAHAEPDVAGGVPHTAVLTSPPQYAPSPFPGPGTPAGRPPRKSGQRGVLLVAASLLVLVLVAVGGLLLLTGRLHTGSGNGGSSMTSATKSAAPTLTPGRTQTVDGLTFTLQQSRTDTTCVGHSYGQVAGFFATNNDCTGLSRALYSGAVAGHQMVAAISHVRMPDAASAEALRKLTDASGTGNVSDLLREGVSYDGGPTALHNSEYASDVKGADVTIVETSWADPASAGSAVQLDSAATSGLALDLPAIPTR